MKPRDEKDVSYDDITREVVPLPDSSHRPTTAEVEQAHTPPAEPTELERFEPSAERSEAGPERGVERSETRGSPRGEARQSIAAAVRAAFADDGYLDGSDLGVVVEGTTAVLQGSVVTDKDRRRAVEIAEGVPGVTEVRDELRVRL